MRKFVSEGVQWLFVGALLFLVMLKTLGFERYGAFEWLLW
jgi:hypothetical protein